MILLDLYWGIYQEVGISGSYGRIVYLIVWGAIFYPFSIFCSWKANPKSSTLKARAYTSCLNKSTSTSCRGSTGTTQEAAHSSVSKSRPQLHPGIPVKCSQHAKHKSRYFTSRSVFEVGCSSRFLGKILGSVARGPASPHTGLMVGQNQDPGLSRSQSYTSPFTLHLSESPQGSPRYMRGRCVVESLTLRRKGNHPVTADLGAHKLFPTAVSGWYLPRGIWGKFPAQLVEETRAELSPQQPGKRSKQRRKDRRLAGPTVSSGFAPNVPRDPGQTLPSSMKMLG